MQTDYRFSIAISFAGDNKRDQVRQVAEILKNKIGDGRVFFDEWFEAELAGHDANTVLQNIYQKSSRLIVTCVCKRYNEKPWTQDEWRAIQSFERTIRDAGSANKKRMRFLPLRFGDGEVDGLFDSAIVPDVRKRSPEQIADLILERLKLSESETDGVFSPQSKPTSCTYDLFLTYFSTDADWVEAIATRIGKMHSFSILHDRWDQIPGKGIHQRIAGEMIQGGCCAVCIGENTPASWVREIIDLALNLQSENNEFVVIPVLTGNISFEIEEIFASLRTLADFRHGEDQSYAFHVLTQGIKHEPIGIWPLPMESLDLKNTLSVHEQNILELQNFRKIGVHEEVVIEFERLILKDWYEEKGKGQ